jgi:hypothetical protein
MIKFENEVQLNDVAEEYIPDIDNLNIPQLLILRAKIEERMPASSLKDLNLEQELVYQYVQVKNILADLQENSLGTAANLAQLSNSIASALAQLVRLQGELYNSERFKGIEQLLVKMLREWPAKNINKFFEAYEENYARQSAEQSTQPAQPAA